MMKSRQSIGCSLCEIFLSIVVIINDILIEFHEFPLIDVEVLEFLIFFTNPYFIPLVIIEALIHSTLNQDNTNFDQLVIAIFRQ